ncbi:PH domain-containing protein [Leucobacter weissii]|uniref:PH domain-containing protein n=2 Tax=Leucobacter weissii TaxID=1983706 RepID=A0A939S712_9MICO|nr:PH domain-containing protein [Leucobacter weissii]MBO1900476.1 PH domain-containing protein [Leucobacter weissii]
MRVRRHGRVLVLPVLVLIALAGASGYFVGALPESWMNWTAGAGAAVLAVLLGIAPMLGWLATRASVTTRRVILRRGFFVHRRSEVPLARIREVRSSRGPVQRLFGSGDVELVVGAESPLVLRDVPRPELVVDALHELIEQNYSSSLAAQPPLAPFGVGPRPGGGSPTTLLPR